MEGRKERGKGTKARKKKRKEKGKERGKSGKEVTMSWTKNNDTLETNIFSSLWDQETDHLRPSQVRETEFEFPI